MDSRAIGVFDSGVGGLTVLKEIHDRLPRESTVYVGDTARIPYGPRSRDTIIHFSRQIVAYLKTQNVKLIVVACSTASAQALATLQAENSIPILGVIEPVAAHAAAHSKNQTIAVIGTKGTINSQAFEQALHRHNPRIQVISRACPLFVPLVEEGLVSGPLLDPALDYYLKTIRDSAADHLILGCTHYPVIQTAIAGYFGSQKIRLLNPGIATAQALKIRLAETKLESNSVQKPVHQYFTTDDPDMFLQVAQNFLGHPIHNHTQKIDLEEV